MAAMGVASGVSVACLAEEKAWLEKAIAEEKARAEKAIAEEKAKEKARAEKAIAEEKARAEKARAEENATRLQYYNYEEGGIILIYTRDPYHCYAGMLISSSPPKSRDHRF